MIETFNYCLLQKINEDTKLTEQQRLLFFHNLSANSDQDI